MCHYSRSRPAAIDLEDAAPERGRRVMLALFAAVPALVLASAVASLVGMG
jgi:hypothetical protein